MPVLTKRARENTSKVPSEPQPLENAVKTLKAFKGPKFDQTVELCMHLNVDTKQADQNLRGSISLPNGIGKSKRVVAFCGEDIVSDALEAGAVKAGGTELAEEIEKGWMDFDVAIASPDMMRHIAKLGRVLGPRGLMPSPKAGTVTPNIADAVKEFAAGKVEYRTDKGGNIHAVVGKMSFSEPDLVENCQYFIDSMEKLRPSVVKGVFIKKITLSGTMTPGVHVFHETAVEA